MRDMVNLSDEESLNASSRADKRLIGAAGEHYAMCQLIRQGFVAARAPEGVALMDIVVSDPTAQKLFAIQVKTRSGRSSDGGWHMGAKHEKAVPNLWYCMVDLGEEPTDPVTCFVIPQAIVRDAVERSHVIWGKGSGIKGQRRKVETTMRRLLPDYMTSNLLRPEITEDDREWLAAHGPGWLEPYQEAWNLLKTDS